MPSLSLNNLDWGLVTTVIKSLSTSRIVDLGRKFTSPYLIVRVSTTGQKDTWFFGGKIWATNLVLGKQAKFYQADLELFEQELLTVPLLFTGKYSLLYEAPKYFSDVTLKVWEYKGIVTTDVLSPTDLTPITNQLNTLSNNLSTSYISQSIEISQIKAQLEQITLMLNNLSSVVSNGNNSNNNNNGNGNNNSITNEFI
jgi:hypothetical protein